MKKWFINFLDSILYLIMLLLILAMGMKISILEEKIEKIIIEKEELQEMYQREINETIETYEKMLETQ